MFSKLSKPSHFQAKRESSYDRTGGNEDKRSIKPGETLVLADVEGPGKIAHIWCTIAAEEVPMFNRMLVLRFYWDGEQSPSVEVPVGDFFGSGHGMEADCITLPIYSVNGGKGRNCFFEMPFKKHALLTITNEAKQEVRSFYWNIDWQKHDSLDDDILYFHAKYRQEFPTVKGKHYTVIDIKGKGNYVGTVLNVEKAEKPGWFGEGDEKVYIDGEEFPTIYGTGTEDYFLTAWCPHIYHSPYSGFSIYEGISKPGSKMTGYRFHVVDPIPFTRSLRFDIEHAWTDQNENFCDHYSSVAYWYQQEPHMSTDKFPEADERRPKYPDNVLYDEFWKTGNDKKGY
ncbi:MAG: DUF2961 domain-containing protein [Clostridia bacterium]|nr:DUF2961 domain-containing protein [Clostridia bacterium]